MANAVLKGTSGLVWGCTDETGGVIQSLSVRDSVEKAYVKNYEGETVGKSMYDRHQVLTVNFVFTGTSTGLGAADPAETLTLSGYTPTAGIITVDEVQTERSNTSYKQVTISAEVFPLITS